MKKKKRIDIPTTKTMKILLGITFGLIAIELILLVLGILSKKIAYFTWTNILLPIKSLIYVISQFFAFKIGTFPISLFYIMILLIVILLLLYEPIMRSEKIKKKDKIKILSFIKTFEIVVFLLEFGIYLIPHLMTYNNPKIDTIYFPKEIKNKYTKEDIFEYTKKLEDKIIEIGAKLERDKKGNIIINEKLEDIAVKDMKKAGERYDFLKGPYPKRYLKFTKKELERKTTLYGLTSVDTVNINYSRPSPITLNIITHELCHTKGIARENEAVLCSVMVGIESDNLLSNYGAYLEAYERAIDALNLIDSSRALSSEDRITSLCIDKKYQEICDMYNKTTDYYVEEAKELEIGTYNTSYYDKEDLINMIKELEEFKPTYYVDGEKIDNSEIYNNLDDNKHISLTIENDKEKFEKIQKILSKYKQKLQYVSQIVPDDYKGVDLTEEEAEDYYTKEVPDSNATIHLDGNMDEVFDYSRATRLIMEYFDHENI